MKSYFAVKALIEKNGEFLIVRRSKKDTHSGEWELPGGKVEKNEGPVEALEREVKEECALKSEIIKPLRACEFTDHKKSRVVIITFLCKYISGEVKLSKEHTEFEWITHEELNKFTHKDWLDKDFAALQCI